MVKLNNNIGAISLVEVLVTSVVFSVAAFGVYSTLSTSQPQSAESVRKLNAAYVGKAAMEDLRRQVADGVWNDVNGAFTTGITHTYTGAPPGYTVTYTMINDPNYPVRRMNMTVSY